MPAVSVFVRLGLMYLVKKMVDRVIAQIKKKGEEILNIISVINGSYVGKLSSWKGKAATEFHNEIQNRLNKQLEALSNTILQLPVGIQQGRECIESADDKATQEVGKLADIFQNIYR